MPSIRHPCRLEFFLFGDVLPNASFIGFTGTPVEKTDANTRAVFGDYIACDMMHGFNWDKWTTGKPAERLTLTTEGQVIDVFTAAGFERQRRGTCQPWATPWECVPTGSSPEGAAQPLSRPFRAWDVLGD